MSTITREQLRERAREKVKSLEFTVTQTAFADTRAELEEELELARIALASLELERGMIRRFDLDMSDCDSCGQDCGADMVEDLDGEYVLWDEVLPHLYRHDEYTAPSAPENAEPVAWLWSHRKHPSEVTLVRPEDDEKAEAALWSGWSCQALYASQPAPVSVPDEVLKRLLPDAEKAEFWFEHDGKILFEGVKFNNAVFEACRDAMLQGADGNSPVIPDGWVMVPVEPTANQWAAGMQAFDSGMDKVTRVYKAMLTAAPQQEVK